jgi:hypothetical protein
MRGQLADPIMIWMRLRANDSGDISSFPDDDKKPLPTFLQRLAVTKRAVILTHDTDA